MRRDRNGTGATLIYAGEDLVGNQAIQNRALVTAPEAPTGRQPTPTAPRPRTPPPPAPKPEHPAEKSTVERPDKDAKKAEAPGPRSPAADPKFQELKKDVNAKKKKVGSSHPPATAEAGAAQAAAVPPADDREARGKAAFIAAVEKAIRDRAPKNLDEADKFGESGKAEEVKEDVQGKVGEGKEGLVRFAPRQPPRYVRAETPL